jgi:hypothetical protein
MPESAELLAVLQILVVLPAAFPLADTGISGAAIMMATVVMNARKFMAGNLLKGMVV